MGLKKKHNTLMISKLSGYTHFWNWVEVVASLEAKTEVGE
jgi:hypothetical protein